MGDPATAMRDPVFYRWHAFVDDIFQEHKNLLPRYNTQQVGTSSTLPFKIYKENNWLLLPGKVMALRNKSS